MNDVNIKGSYETPSVAFNSAEGKLLIAGRSLPEDSIAFYKPLLIALENYTNSPSNYTNVDFKLEYFNTSSSKCILDILRILQKIHANTGNVIINWYHDEDDEEMLEIGQDYSHIVNVPFNIKIISSN